MGERAWDPIQYERFRAERSQPFFDLLARVAPRPRMRVVDLGCGTGDLTRHLHEALRAQETVGLDSSAEMLSRSENFNSEGLRFEWGDLATFEVQGYDLVFSNAALQWADDHPALLSRIAAQQAEGAQLAFQVPANFDHASHEVAREIANEMPFWQEMHGYERQVSVLPPEEYASMLYRLGYREQQVCLQVYGHVLEGPEAVLEWVKGTLLTDYRKRLGDESYVRFLERYRERLLEVLPASRPFFYPFKRILVWARK